MSLLTLTQQQTYKSLSPNWASTVKNTGGTTNYEQLESEVEEDDLQNLLGPALLQAIQTSVEDATDVYDTLLDGGTFTDCNKNEIKFKGLRYVLSYMVYSEYIAESYVSDTMTGFTTKERTEARGLNSTERKELKIKARRKAMIQWNLCKQYLNENKDDYELWIVEQSSTKTYKPTLKGVRKTIRR